MEYKLWGSPKGRHEYQVELFKLAMEKTAGDYPPYTLLQNSESLGSLRGRREVARGELINFYATPFRSGEDPQQSKLIAIPVPLLKGLLGYRKLIIRRSEFTRFTGIDESALKSLKAGQGRGWPDVAVFRENGYNVIDSGLFPDLFSMLDQGRFDFLPLGIMEADEALANYAQALDSLDTFDSIYLYYPLPVIFYVSAREPLLAERLQKGLEMAVMDGSRDALFNEHFDRYLVELSRPGHRLFILKNSTLENAMGLSQPVLSQSVLSQSVLSQPVLSQPAAVQPELPTKQ